VIDPVGASGDIVTTEVDRCPACGDGGRVVHREVPDRLHGIPGRWTIRCCSACGSLWLDPRPADDQLTRCYPSAYFTHHAPDVEPAYAPLHGLKGLARRHILVSVRGYEFDDGPARPTVLGRALAAVVPVRTRATSGLGPLLMHREHDRRLLDVGCGDGSYLAQMREYGWDVTGQEIDPAAAATARTRRGIDVVGEPLGALASRTPGFDVVTGSHVLEHVVDPRAFLAEAVSCLRPGGRLVMVTPNGASLGHRVFGDEWFSLDPPRHLAVYTGVGLRRIAASVPGMVDVRVSSLARSARKVYRLSKEARREGRFRTGRPPARGVGVGSRAFAAAEQVLATVAPVGEELVLQARRSG
jgi:2-polyprenyl-3-methyl-5-hydroxy-6-metoxy-1,4-benzoquinol methylase